MFPSSKDGLITKIIKTSPIAPKGKSRRKK